MHPSTNALFLALSELRSHWVNFPVNQMLFFLEVAKNDFENREWGVLEIGARIELKPATVSRYVDDLGPTTIPKGSSDTINLVTTKPDRFDHRKRIPVLTEKGKRVYAKLVRIMERNRL